MQNALKSIMDNEKSQICRGELIMNNIRISLLIDGRDNYLFDILELPIPEYIVRGDSKIKQIMAASIMAKVTRDNLMKEFDGQFP